MGYWAVARLERNRERLALHCLGLRGYEIYYPQLRQYRISQGRKIEIQPPLFPGYAFVVVEAQWYAARWSVGVIGMIMDGVRSARVADSVILDIRKRESNGVVVLPSRGFRRGDRVRIVRGPLSGLDGLVDGLRSQQRIEILLAVLGRVELAAADVEATR
jgi:transcriptional antiterminator RfaH